MHMEPDPSEPAGSQAPYRYEYLYPDEFLAQVSRMPVFLVPLGLLEWHGDHLPLGTDALKAHGLCLRIADRLRGGIVLPALPIGRPGYSRRVGTLTFAEATVAAMLEDLLGQLRKVGARVVLVLSGHYGDCQMDLVRRVAEDFGRRHGEMRILATAEYEGVLVDGVPPADHAKKHETALMAALHPGLVRMEAYRTGPRRVHCYEDVPYDVYREPDLVTPEQDLPALATPAFGERIVGAVVSRLSGWILDALAELGIPHA